jgi:hypothetical protein
MAGRQDFTTPRTAPQEGATLAVQNRPEIEQSITTNTSSLASGNSETVEIYAPAGSVYRVIGMLLNAEKDADAAGGAHRFVVETAGQVRMLRGESAHTEAVRFDNGTWDIANNDQSPADGDVQTALQALTATENEPISIKYINDLDVPQEESRTYRFAFEEVGY